MESVSSAQLRLLITYHLREGFSSDRVELAVAQLHATTINMNSKKGAKKISPKDILAYYDAWSELQQQIDPQGFELEQFRNEFANVGRVVRKER